MLRFVLYLLTALDLVSCICALAISYRYKARPLSTAWQLDLLEFIMRIAIYHQSYMTTPEFNVCWYITKEEVRLSLQLREFLPF